MNQSPPTVLSHDSRKKILDTAEALFADNGFSDPSLRTITTAAGVNLAAVNYYFGSKDNLIVEVLSRAIQPLNNERFRLLTEAEARHGTDPVPVPEIIEAMIRPCLQMCLDPQREQVNRLLSRSLSEKGNFIEKLFERDWTPVCLRFMEALQRSLPCIPQEELHWRMHFIVGAFVHTSCHHHDLTLLSKGLCKFEFEPTLRRLIGFSTAGIQACSKQSSAS